MPHLAPWQWLLGAFCAYLTGVAKTGAPGVSSLVAPLMVMMVGDARFAAAWSLPILSTADVFAVLYWSRQAEARELFSLIPWVLAGMAGGALALSLSELVIRRMIGVVVVGMLVMYLYRRWGPATEAPGNAALYGICAGFATTIANAAGPVMNLYLLSRKLPKETFVATGAWFFFVVNLTKFPVYGWYHLFSRTSLTFDLLMVPVVLAGALGGQWLIRHMPQRVFEVLVIGLTAISCVFLFR